MPSDVNRPDGDLSFDEFDDFYKSEQGRAGVGQGAGRETPTDPDDGGDPGGFGAGDVDGIDFGDDRGDRPDSGGPLDDFSAAGPLSDEDFTAAPPRSVPGSGRFDRDDFQDDLVEAPPASDRRGPGVDDPGSSDDLFATLDDVMDSQMVGDHDDEDFQDDFDDDDEEEEGGRSLLPMIIALVTVLVFGGLVYFAYTNNYLDPLLAGDEADTPEAIPVVEAPQGPVRERPVDRGGLRVSGQSNEALNPDIRRTETILLDDGPEQPMPLGDRAAEVPADNADGGSAAWGDLKPTSPVEMLEPVTIPRDIAAATEPAPAPTPAPRSNTQPANTQPANTQPANTQPASQPRQPVPEPASTPPAQSVPPAPAPAAVATAPVTRQAATGPYRVQLASMGSQAAARREWQRLQRQVPDLLGALPMTIERALIAGRGTFFRVQAGGMGRAGADRLCNQLKSRGLSCLIVR